MSAERVLLNINWNTTNHAASNMYWDDANQRIGIGQSSPAFPLDIGEIVHLSDAAGIYSDSVALTGQTSSISATNLVATPSVTGLYQISYYMNDTTAGTSGTVTVTFTWNDGASQSVTSSTLTFGTLGAYVSGMLVVKATSGAIQYSTTVTSAVGSPAYSLDIRVLPLT